MAPRGHATYFFSKSYRAIIFDIREIKIPVYDKRQTSDSRYPSAVIYVTIFWLSFTST